VLEISSQRDAAARIDDEKRNIRNLNATFTVGNTDAGSNGVAQLREMTIDNIEGHSGQRGGYTQQKNLACKHAVRLHLGRS